MTFDLSQHIQRHGAWTKKTFGPGPQTARILDHILSELTEIEAAPYDIEEWIDLIGIALDGARRALEARGATEEHAAQTICDTLVYKQNKNEARNWPDWRTADPDKAIEHIGQAEERGTYEFNT